MLNGVRRTALLAGAVALLAGCAKEPPKCSDEQTVALVRKIVLEMVGEKGKLSEQEMRDNLKLEFPRASAYDEKVQKYSCEARLLAGGSYQLPITYQSQVDDAGDHVVAVDGMAQEDGLLISLAVTAGLEKTRRGAAASPAAPTTPAAPAEPAPAGTAPVPAAEAPAPAAPASAPAAPQARWKPSFDCAAASTPVETAVCTDPLLGRLDGALAENYRGMLAADIGDEARAELRATQRQWAADRGRCTTAECLAQSYRERIDSVCEYPVVSGVHPACHKSEDVQ